MVKVSKLLRSYPYQSLVLVSFLATIIWRIEVEFHGWTGLIWISYFHWAVPIGFALLMLWANIFVKATPQKRILGNLLVILLGAICYVTFSSLMGQLYGRSLYSPGLSVLLGPALMLILSPVCIFGMLKLFGHHTKPIHILYSILGLIVSVPLAIQLLDWIGHKGGADFLHAIKSGLIITFWMISLGILVIGTPIQFLNRENK